MIKFNKNNNTEKIDFQSKIKKDAVVKPVKDFLSKVAERAEFELTDVGAFKAIEELADNPNAYQEVSKYGVRIRPVDFSHNSKERVLELVATKKDENVSRYVELMRGTRDEILATIKNPKFYETLKEHVVDSSQYFFLKD